MRARFGPSSVLFVLLDSDSSNAPEALLTGSCHGRECRCGRSFGLSMRGLLCLLHPRHPSCLLGLICLCLVVFSRRSSPTPALDFDATHFASTRLFRLLPYTAFLLVIRTVCCLAFDAAAGGHLRASRGGRGGGRAGHGRVVVGAWGILVSIWCLVAYCSFSWPGRQAGGE